MSSVEKNPIHGWFISYLLEGSQELKFPKEKKRKTTTPKEKTRQMLDHKKIES